MHQIVTKTRTYPLSCEWEIDELSLRSKTVGCFNSPEFSIDGLPDVKWFLQIYPNGVRQPHDHLSAYINIQSTKNIYLTGKFFIKGTTLKKRVRHTFTKERRSGSKCLIPLSELYETYVQNGKLTIELQATIALDETATTFLIGNNNNNNGENGLEITPSLATFMFEDNESKDVTLIVGHNSLQAHCKVLGYHSPVFERMFFNGRMTESIERKVEITDFDFQVIECAVHFCYDMLSPSIHVSEYPFEQLLRFADKYDMKKLMDFCERSLILKIDTSNVCELIQLANDVNAFSLKEKCVAFMSAHIDSTTSFQGLENLDSSIVKQIMLSIITP